MQNFLRFDQKKVIAWSLVVFGLKIGNGRIYFFLNSGLKKMAKANIRETTTKPYEHVFYNNKTNKNHKKQHQKKGQSMLQKRCCDLHNLKKPMDLKV